MLTHFTNSRTHNGDRYKGLDSKGDSNEARDLMDVSEARRAILVQAFC
ncbi:MULTISPECIES: hypothetical protein [Fischerella]|nr:MULTISPECIES: hypothetical protein [Fischerella]MBD2431264.1 hypothetical protein [Fischerella sp. FACHB-380]